MQPDSVVGLKQACVRLSPKCFEKKSYFLDFLETKSYFNVPVNLIETGIFEKKQLSATSKLAFLYLYARSFFAKYCSKSKTRLFTLSAKTLAKRLGRSEKTARTLLEELAQAGFCRIRYCQNRAGRELSREIEICFPEELLTRVAKAAPERRHDESRLSLGESLSKTDSTFTTESLLSYCEATKHSVQIPFQLLKEILRTRQLGANAKLIWFSVYFKSHGILKRSGSCEVTLPASTLYQGLHISKRAFQYNLGSLKASGFITKDPQAKFFSDRAKFILSLPELMRQTVQKSDDRKKVDVVNKQIKLQKSLLEQPIQVYPSTGVQKTPGRGAKNPGLITNFLYQTNKKNFLEHTKILNQKTSQKDGHKKEILARPEPEKVFFEKTQELPMKSPLDEKVQTVEVEKTLKHFNANVEKLKAIDFTEFEARNHAGRNLSPEERSLLTLCAIQAASKAKKTKTQSALSPNEKTLLHALENLKQFGQIFDVKVRSIWCEQTAFSFCEKAPQKKHSAKTNRPNIKPLPPKVVGLSTQQPSAHLPIPLQEIHSLEPEALLSAQHLAQLRKFLGVLSKTKAIRGEAAQIPLPRLEQEVAFMAARFPMRKPKGDRTALAISIGCRLLREGRWTLPFGFVERQEAIWAQKKKELFGSS